MYTEELERRMMGESQSTDLNFFRCMKEISRKIMGLRQSTDLDLLEYRGRKWA